MLEDFLDQRLQSGNADGSPPCLRSPYGTHHQNAQPHVADAIDPGEIEEQEGLRPLHPFRIGSSAGFSRGAPV